MKASKVEVMVLGSLGQEPAYGYDLLERFRDRSMGFWMEVGKASVYQTLHRLERTGLVSGRAQEGTEGPDRRVFRITNAGRKRLREASAELAADLSPFESSAGVVLGIAYSLPGIDARAAVDARERALRDLLDRVAAVRTRRAAERGPERAVSDAMLGLQEALAKAELEWLPGFRAQIGKAKR